ncbi:hypothetical protein D3C80_2192950 [compost metagenome]
MRLQFDRLVLVHLVGITQLTDVFTCRLIEFKHADRFTMRGDRVFQFKLFHYW